jgi:hypothetical protein
MVFVAARGKAFSEDFTFKNEKGKLIGVPSGDYVLTLEHDKYVRQFTNLRTTRTGIVWSMTEQETQDLKYNNLSFVLTFNGQEIARGILRVS